MSVLLPFELDDHESMSPSIRAMSSSSFDSLFPSSGSSSSSSSTDEDLLNSFEGANYDSLPPPSASLFYTESSNTIYDTINTAGLNYLSSITSKNAHVSSPSLPSTSSSLWTKPPEPLPLSAGPASALSNFYGTSPFSSSPFYNSPSYLTASSSSSLTSLFSSYNTTENITTLLFDTVMNNGGDGGSQNLSTAFNLINNSTFTINNNTNITDQEERNIFILPLYQQIIWSVIFGTMVSVAAGGNLIVILIVLTNKRMRTVTNYFLVNLSIADIMLSTLNGIFNFIYMLNSDWPFGEIYCKVTNFIAILSVAASVFTLMAISIDRYLAIVHPLRPRMSRRTTVNIIIVIWIAASLLSSPNIVCSKTVEEEFLNGDKRVICLLEWYDDVSPRSKIEYFYNVIILLVTYLLPITSMCYTYFWVGRELWGWQSIGECTAKQMESIKSKRKIVKMMMIVVAIFGLCWAPYHIWFLLAHHYPQLINSKYTQHTYLGIYWLAISNSAYNPFVYCWLNSRFRQGFRNVFCCSYFRNYKPTQFLGPGRYHGAARYSCASEACITQITDTRVRFNGNGNITLQPTITSNMTTSINQHNSQLSDNSNEVGIALGTLTGHTTTTTTTTTTTSTNSSSQASTTTTTTSPLQSKVKFASTEML